jgi:hypothetical protein
MTKCDQNGIPSSIVRKFVNESTSDKYSEPSIAKPELFTDFKVADRIFFMSCMGQVITVETDTLIGHGQVEAPVVGPETDMDGFGGVAMIPPFDRILTKFKNSLTQTTGFGGHPGHKSNAVQDPSGCPL